MAFAKSLQPAADNHLSINLLLLCNHPYDVPFINIYLATISCNLDLDV